METSNLYLEYNAKRNLTLSEDEFGILITLFPAVLVATADHQFDATEKEYIAEVVAGAALELYESEEQAEPFGEILYAELLFLSEHNNPWQNTFLVTLAEQLLPEDKDAMEKLLTETAEVSKGIVLEEQAEIDRIMKSINN